MPDGAGDLRDHRRVGGFLDAVARSAPAHRDRRGARLPRSRGAAARALRHAGGQERRRREGANCESVLARELARASSPITRSDGSPWTLTLADVMERAASSRWPTTPTTASSCAGARRRGATRPRPASATPAGAAREDERVPRLVPRAPPPAAGVTFAVIARESGQSSKHRCMRRLLDRPLARTGDRRRYV